MPNKRYLAGVRLERAIKHKLEEDDYACFRMAGSHSVADLIAVSPTELLFIQCKKALYISKEERTKIKQFLYLYAPSYAKFYVAHSVNREEWELIPPNRVW